ncbi:hypothetical protein O3P69_008654 [Scylla paramamosain]|uniref:TGF-beta family profile domain-containing protein n=1 Tax=Scylla paramamosain TaxID=85552 RepID=A0AAW0SLP1_SCYPA
MAAVGVTSLPPLSLPSSPTLAQDSEVSPSQLLKAFGLSEPGVRRWHSEPPQYMLDLYNEVADANGLTRLPGPYGATIVRSFSEKGRPLLQSFLEVRWLGSEEHLMVGRQHIAAHSSGWRVFKLGSGVVAGQGSAVQNVSHVNLQVTAVTSEGRPLSLVFHHEPRGARRPLLVLFNTLAANATADPPPLPAGKQQHRPPNGGGRRVPRSVDVNALPRGCQRRDMHVNFEAIGWSSWILYPQVYNAYQCQGQCAFPLIQSVNPTNHATVQSFIHHVGKAPGVQTPCCVPSLYGNLTLLFYDSEENVVLKQYDQMVALQCGCH